jgi:hypothetical protein
MSRMESKTAVVVVAQLFRYICARITRQTTYKKYQGAALNRDRNNIIYNASVTVEMPAAPTVTRLIRDRSVNVRVQYTLNVYTDIGFRRGPFYFFFPHAHSISQQGILTPHGYR